MSISHAALQPLLAELRAKLGDRLFSSDDNSYSLLNEAPTAICLELCNQLAELESADATIESALSEFSLEDRYLIDLIRHVYLDCCSTPTDRNYSTELERSLVYAVGDELEADWSHTH